MIGYLDAAVERLEDESSSDFDALVEGVRTGYIFAHEQRQYSRWRQRRRTETSRTSSGGGGLTGQALERAVMGLASRHPEYVVFGGA